MLLHASTPPQKNQLNIVLACRLGLQMDQYVGHPQGTEWVLNHQIFEDIGRSLSISSMS